MITINRQVTGAEFDPTTTGLVTFSELGFPIQNSSWTPIVHSVGFTADVQVDVQLELVNQVTIGVDPTQRIVVKSSTGIMSFFSCIGAVANVGAGNEPFELRFSTVGLVGGQGSLFVNISRQRILGGNA